MDGGRTRDHAVQVEEEGLKFAEVDVLQRHHYACTRKTISGQLASLNPSPYRLCTLGFETAAPSEGDQVARVAPSKLEDSGTSFSSP